LKTGGLLIRISDPEWEENEQLLTLLVQQIKRILGNYSDYKLSVDLEGTSPSGRTYPTIHERFGGNR
jgi:hypothetical protein